MKATISQRNQAARRLLVIAEIISKVRRMERGFCDAAFASQAGAFMDRCAADEVTGLEAKYTNREGRRIKIALQTARLTTVKTLSGYASASSRSSTENA